MLEKNPKLTNLLISDLVMNIEANHRDDVASALLRGGRKVNPVTLHPAMSQLASHPRRLVAQALSRGWQTMNEKTLLAQLKSLPIAPQ